MDFDPETIANMLGEPGLDCGEQAMRLCAEDYVYEGDCSTEDGENTRAGGEADVVGEGGEGGGGGESGVIVDGEPDLAVGNVQGDIEAGAVGDEAAGQGGGGVEDDVNNPALVDQGYHAGLAGPRNPLVLDQPVDEVLPPMPISP